MTLLGDPPDALRRPPGTADADRPTSAPAPMASDDDGRAPVVADERSRLRNPVLAWLAITVVGIVLVLFALGPLTEERDQRRLLEDLRVEIESATQEAFGLAGIETPTMAPEPGTAVAVLDVAPIDVRRVVVEQATPEQTRQGPAHVSGTAGLGQPGNAVVVGRRSLFGGAFAELDQLEVGDRLLVSTVQGQTVYEVAHVGEHTIVEGDADGGGATAGDPAAEEGATPDEGDAATDAGGDDETTADADGSPSLPEGEVTTEELYGPSADDRLTLITAASAAPWVDDRAVVVVAHMDGVPFEPTPQGGRTAAGDGRSGEPRAVAPVLLALLVYAAAVAGAVWMHRRLPWRSAHLLTAPVLIALTVVLAESLAALAPAWT